MLQFLDGYPCKLPARYTDKHACYTKVFIISNIPFNKQYINIQENEHESFEAFKRRFTKFLIFDKIDRNKTYYDKDNVIIDEMF